MSIFAPDQKRDWIKLGSARGIAWSKRAAAMPDGTLVIQQEYAGAIWEARVPPGEWGEGGIDPARKLEVFTASPDSPNTSPPEGEQPHEKSHPE